MKKIFGLALLLTLGAGCAPQDGWYNTLPTSAPAPVATSTTKTAPPTTQQKTTKPKTTVPVSQKVTVTITDAAFSPQVIAVHAGDTVVWVNKGMKNHTTASSAALIWDSGNIPPGGSYSRKFSAAGSYPYNDGVTNHTGTVVVR